MERPHWKHLVLIWGFENWGFSVVCFFFYYYYYNKVFF
jgi:hypothetical protein